MKSIFFVILGIAAVVADADAAQISNRTFLGERNVSDRAEYDVIRVGPGQGTFDALQVKVRGAPVEIKRIRIYFANGSVQTVERNIVLNRNGWSAVTGLTGNKRRIEKVVFYYETRSPGWHTAELQLYGWR